ncbi:hypothetical protein [Roseateles depolymerans]|uniref:hypothetical protein n=1 Tax=Roseateles depolymerans TaxID=76731 RepID=UPI0011C071BF|nr:hypothetical protein [Roseateles depolymerans]
MTYPDQPSGPLANSGGGAKSEAINTPIWVYGHSFTTDPGSWCTAGNEFFKLAAKALGASGSTSYGVASGRAVDTAQDVVGQAVRTAKTGSTWVGTRRGLVIVDTQANDSYNPADFNANTPTVPLTAVNRANFRDCMRTIFAVLSSASRVDSSAFTGQTGTWVSGAGAQYSNAELQRTAVQGSTSTYAVTVPSAGYVWLLTYVVVADAGQGQFTVTEGGTTYLTYNASDYPCASIFSRRGSGGAQTVFPVMLKIVASPGVHNFTITKTDATATNIYIDAFFVPHDRPVPIITFLDQLPIYDAGGAGMNGPVNYPLTVANKAALDVDVRTVASEFSNVIVLADPDVAENRSLGDKFHPGDFGMASRSDAIITAVNSLTAAQQQGLYATP